MAEVPSLKVRVVADTSAMHAELDLIARKIADIKASAADLGVQVAAQVEHDFAEALGKFAAQAQGEQAPAEVPVPVVEPVEHVAPVEEQPNA